MDATGSGRMLGHFETCMFDAAMSWDVASQPFESALPVRSFYGWPGKRNYEGSWWSSMVRARVGFESLRGRESPLAIDYDRDVVGIAAQPFAMLWPKGTQAGRGMPWTRWSVSATAAHGLWMTFRARLVRPRSNTDGS